MTCSGSHRAGWGRNHVSRPCTALVERAFRTWGLNGDPHLALPSQDPMAELKPAEGTDSNTDGDKATLSITTVSREGLG